MMKTLSKWRNKHTISDKSDAKWTENVDYFESEALKD